MKAKLFFIFLAFILALSFFSLTILAEQTWYVKIVNGTILSTETQKTLVPLEIKIFKQPPLEHYYTYIGNKFQLSGFIEERGSGEKITNIFIKNDIFESLLSTNKQEINEKIYPTFKQISDLLIEIYSQINTNLKKDSISFSEAQTTSINLKILPDGQTYKLEFARILLNKEADFASFLLNTSKPTPFDLNETNAAKKQKNITIASRKIDVYLKDVNDIYRKGNLQPFREIKTANFEIKENALVTADIASSELSDTVAYYLPQGIVIFPNDEKEIETKFYSKGTSYLPETLNQNESKIRNTKGYVVFLPKEVLLNGTFSIKINGNNIESVYLAQGTSFCYNYNNNLNCIDSFSNTEFYSSTQKQKVDCGIVFYDNWTLEFVCQPTKTLAKEMDFNYNGYRVVLQRNIATPNTQLFFYPIEIKDGNKVAKIEGKAAYRDTYNPPGSIFEVGASGPLYKSFELLIFGEERATDLIEKAKKIVPAPSYPPLVQVEVKKIQPEPIGRTTIVKGQMPPEECSKIHRGYSCRSFRNAITQPSFDYNGLSYTCIITADCDGNWCCHGGNNRRCCRATKKIGNRKWEFKYRKASSYVPYWVGTPGMDISYSYDSKTIFAARYDKYGLRPMPEFEDLMKKDNQAKADWEEFEKWFNTTAKGNIDIELTKVWESYPENYFPDLNLPQLIAGKLPGPEEIEGEIPPVRVIAHRETDNTQQFTLNSPSLDQLVLGPTAGNASKDVFLNGEHYGELSLTKGLSLFPGHEKNKNLIEKGLDAIKAGEKKIEQDIENRRIDYFKRTFPNAKLKLKIEDNDRIIELNAVEDFIVKFENESYNLYKWRRGSKKIGEIFFENGSFKLNVFNRATFDKATKNIINNRMKIKMSKTEFNSFFNGPPQSKTASIEYK